jgi:hypothetical protein
MRAARRRRDERRAALEAEGAARRDAQRADAARGRGAGRRGARRRVGVDGRRRAERGDAREAREGPEDAEEGDGLGGDVLRREVPLPEFCLRSPPSRSDPNRSG